MSERDRILITGAAGNLGAAVARLLAGQGARLALAERSAEKLSALVATLPKGANALELAGVDLGDPNAAADMVEKITGRFGGLDALVNTVGGFSMGRVATEAVGQWDAMMNANARVALVLSAAVLPVMREAKYGRIVHIAAQPGLKAGAGVAAYAASKAALLRLTEAIAEEHRKDGITANCVLPGTIDTPQNRAAMPDAKTDGWVKPEAIAGLIAFLVSEQSGVVTGGAIPATGLS